MILNTSDEAARYVENIKGWVSRDGRYYGDDERTARWAGATHVACVDCGEPVEKNWVKCEPCREKADAARYAAYPRKPWAGAWLYSEAAQEFFEDEDALRDWLDDPDRDYTVETLRLVHCDPVYPHFLDGDDLYGDDLPEDCSLRDVAGELDEWIGKVNECIATMRKAERPLSWRPSKVAVALDSLPADLLAASRVQGEAPPQ